MTVGVVITVAEGREANLRDVLRYLGEQTVKPEMVVCVWDGHDPGAVDAHGLTVRHERVAKHYPGHDQPRNVGARLLDGCDWVWFLDSDIAVAPDCLERFRDAIDANPVARIMVGPYVFMSPGLHGLHPELPLDTYRTTSFLEHPADEVCFHPVGAGLACFGGNFVCPVSEFWRVGGFWNDLHHGRCEDGEFGIRAVMAGLGVSFVKDARGYHQAHDRNVDWIRSTNAIDVPKINRRHPFMPDAVGDHLLMTAKDGIRFDFRCPGCGERMNSLLFWEHCGGSNWECPSP